MCILDTSVFCEILRVPNMSSAPEAIKRELQTRILANENLVLPMTTILETGNHIGQNGNGGARWRAAQRFVEQVTRAIAGTTPFTATAFVDRASLLTWLGEFPEWACAVDARGKGSGLGDLTIYKEWQVLCDKFPDERVYIWSKDAQLACYDRVP